MPDESTPNEIVTGEARKELLRLARQMYATPESVKGRPDLSDAHVPTPTQATITLSRRDRLQAKKHHPEFQRCLTQWREILRKEQKGITPTDEEAALMRAPRSGFNGDAEMEASRYGLLSLMERELSTMTEEELAWRDVAPQLDRKNKVAVVHIPLWWTVAAAETTVRRIVRIYKNWIDLADAKYMGPPLDSRRCAPQLLRDTLILRIPLQFPVEIIDKVVGQTVRAHRKNLGLASTQCIRRPDNVDPWLVYRLHQEEKLSLIDIVRRLFNVEQDANPANDEEVKRQYDQVRRAYAFAKAAIDRIGEEYA